MEIMVALLHKKKKMMMMKVKIDRDDGGDDDEDGIPHQIRGNVGGFSQILLRVSARRNDDDCNDDTDGDDHDDYQ